ncbi:hypothetical protein N2601_30600 (plasmid) [Rhizobium sp. CB3060]|uniref:hypothetical protein n=1 Tax=Rhizobium sp. CB3060 TaxID=3138255 RepID=UPI0021A4715A|nr:hypothetical protein [Rhizobium tropici]UWU25776.1 hypothetical protein N2601_30600 [Rhizobium tropici]
MVSDSPEIGSPVSSPAERHDEDGSTFSQYIRNHEAILGLRDLEICELIFEQIFSRLNLMKDVNEAQRLAPIVVTLYKQGIHDERHLARLAGAWPLLANPFLVKYFAIDP